jgi:hypothetical protein
MTMKRASTALAAALLTGGLAACSPSTAPAPSPTATPAKESPSPAASAEPSATPVDAGAATVEALAHAYQFVPAGESEPACMIRLDAVEQQGDDAKPFRRAWIEPDCYKKFPVLQKLARWAPSGDAGASLDLLDSTGKEIGHFSPVQDTSVYLRGGAGGKIYEMRDPAE